MKCVSLSCVLIAGAAFPSIAAAADRPETLEALIERSARITITQALPAGGAADHAVIEQFANGDMLVRHGVGEGVPIVLTICKRATFLNTAPDKAGAAPLSGNQLRAIRGAQYMGALAGMAMLTGVAGRDAELPAAGASIRTEKTTSWAYGRERYALEVSRDTDGQVRVQATKIATETTTPASGPDDLVSTDDDRAARLAELEPVGTRREMAVSPQARGTELSATLPLRGWVDASGDTYANVGKARDEEPACSK
jgi:hypothetical protein